MLYPTELRGLAADRLHHPRGGLSSAAGVRQLSAAAGARREAGHRRGTQEGDPAILGREAPWTSRAKRNRVSGARMLCHWQPWMPSSCEATAGFAPL